jgi:ribonuclease P protein component
LALPQRHRLKGQRVFDRVYQKGRRIHGPFLVLRILEALPSLLPAAQRTCPASPWRCGVVVSSKVHKRSVRRNRLRRLLHAHLLAQPIEAGDRCLWLLLSLKPEAGATAEPLLLEECTHLLRKAGLLHDPGSPP